MSRYIVVWRPLARSDLLALYDWIADRADAETAFEYAAAMEAHTTKLAFFPERGMPRDDLVPGLRTIVYQRRTIIAYRVGQNEVEILRLLHAGQDWSGFE